MDPSSAKRLTHAVSILRTPEELFAAWHDPTRIAAHLRHLQGRFEEEEEEEGEAEPRTPLTFQVVNDVEPALIEWVAREGDSERFRGTVTFREAPGRRGTEVRLSVTIDDATGRLQKTLDRFRGRGPSFLIHEDLRNFKQLMETGEFPTTRGQPSGKRTLKGRALLAFLEEKLQREFARGSRVGEEKLEDRYQQGVVQ